MLIDYGKMPQELRDYFIREMERELQQTESIFERFFGGENAVLQKTAETEASHNDEEN